MTRRLWCLLAAGLVLCLGSARASADLLRFATYNSYNLGYNGVITGSKYDALAGVMNTINADIWAIQEIRDAAAFSEFVNTRLTGLYSTVVLQGNSSYQVGLISRYPIESVVDHSNDRANDGTRIFSRTALEATIRIGEQLITVISTHLQPGYDRDARNIEGQRLAEIISALPSDRPVIVMGDFNDVYSASSEPVPSPVNLVTAAGLIAAPARNDISRSTATYSSISPVIRYDYVFMSQSYYEKLTQYAVFTSSQTKTASDHLPVWAEVDVEIVPEPASLALWSAVPAAIWLRRRRRRRSRD